MMKPLEAIVGVGLDVKSVFLDIVAVLASMANILPRNLSYIIKEWNAVSKDQSFMGSLQRIGSRSMTLLTALPRLFDPTGKSTGETGNVMSDFYGFRYALESKLNKAAENDKKKKTHSVQVILVRQTRTPKKSKAVFRRLNLIPRSQRIY